MPELGVFMFEYTGSEANQASSVAFALADAAAAQYEGSVTRLRAAESWIVAGVAPAEVIETWREAVDWGPGEGIPPSEDTARALILRAVRARAGETDVPLDQVVHHGKGVRLEPDGSARPLWP